MFGHLLVLPSGIASAVLAIHAIALFTPSLYSETERAAAESIAWLAAPLVSMILLPRWIGFQFAGFFFILSIAVLGRKRHSFIRQTLKAALNFQLSIAIASLVFSIVFVASLWLIWQGGIDTNARYVNLILGMTVLLSIFGIFQISGCAIAALRAIQGKTFRYPLAFQFWR
jgi:uncharacterized Tic20 family protein